VYCDQPIFVSFFQNFGNAWRTLLALPNETLGVNDAFREMLKKDLLRVQRGINELLKGLFADELLDSACEVDMIDDDGCSFSDSAGEEEEDDEEEPKESEKKRLKKEEPKESEKKRVKK
jgi:hypothetical protein